MKTETEYLKNEILNFIFVPDKKKVCL